MEIRCAVIGYGDAFNMGKHHATQMEQTGLMKVVAVCDLDPQRLEVAKADFPNIRTYQSVDEMLTQEDFDLAVIVTPHNTHAPLALKCLKAGKHVIVEKPMCLTVKEATAMIETARQKGVILTVYHNHHWDGDFMALWDIVQTGVIGNIFRVEMFGGGYHKSGNWWRSDKSISGGLFLRLGRSFPLVVAATSPPQNPKRRRGVSQTQVARSHQRRPCASPHSVCQRRHRRCAIFPRWQPPSSLVGSSWALTALPSASKTVFASPFSFTAIALKRPCLIGKVRGTIFIAMSPNTCCTGKSWSSSPNRCSGSSLSWNMPNGRRDKAARGWRYPTKLERGDSACGR
jgi:hypothetical protein